MSFVHQTSQKWEAHRREMINQIDIIKGITHILLPRKEDTVRPCEIDARYERCEKSH